MSAVESQMLPLGTQAPAFTLPDPDGTLHSLRDDAEATLVMFICNHCPFVVHVRSELARIGSDYALRGVAIYAINSNDVRAALDAVLASETPEAEQKPSIGCNIKWTAGNEPEYF